MILRFFWIAFSTILNFGEKHFNYIKSRSSFQWKGNKGKTERMKKIERPKLINATLLSILTQKLSKINKKNPQTKKIW